jgi:pimeloyl-ACP methyl ester carboxylesterase
MARRGLATKAVSKRARTSAADAAVAAPSPPPATYAPALNAGLQAIASRVQEMHQAISGTTFDNLLRVPGLAVPTRIVQGVHDAVAQGVYAAVRHGGGAALSIAADAERLASDPLRQLGPKEQALHSAVSGVVGDALAKSGSALAVQMGLHAGGAPLPITRAALAQLQPRVCVFIHGLACDEQSWSLRTEAWQGSAWADVLGAGRRVDYDALLEHELGVSAIALRYNTGLAIDANASRLAALLERAAQAAPQVTQWLLIGHSMGGLVARRAHELAQADGLVWAQRAPMIVCLGSPHQGAPLEKIGHVAAAALNLSSVTKPLARIADARSQGIKDLRHGSKKKPRAKAPVPPALRLVFATLGDEGDRIGGMTSSWIGKLFGDGLVRAGSAADEGASGDVQRVELAGLGHMALLNHPRVYAVLRRWLGAPELA